jgi:hypothetical protein
VLPVDPEPLEPAEPAVEPDAVLPALPALPVEDPPLEDDESRRPRTSTFEFTYFSSSLFEPPVRV